MGLFTKDIKTMDDLFLHTLQDIYYAENKIVKSLPDMIANANDAQLKSGLQSHLGETKGHVQRLEQVFQMLGKKAASVDCPAIDGIIDEAEDGSGDVEDKDLLDAAIWWGGQCLPQQRGPAAQLILHRPHFVGTSSARGRCSEVRHTRCGC